MYQQWRKSITTLAFVLAGMVSAGALAQAPKTPLALKPDAPDRYVVVPGDSLWSIAQRYTDSPWRWPELWNLNKDEIKDPHRIYPGNVIVLDRARGRLALSDTVKLSPKVRAESTAHTPIPSIPSSVIEPFLTRPLVIEPNGLDNAPTIVAAGELRVHLETGSFAAVRGIEDAKVDSQWYVYRPGPALVDPDSKSTLGFEAIHLGNARVVRSGETAIIELTSVVQEVQVGDKLVAAGKPDIKSYAPRAPSTQVRGRVLSQYGGRDTRVAEFGDRSIIAINLGKSHGIEFGHVLALYRPGSFFAENAQSPRQRSSEPISLPDARYGTAFVFRVFDQVSYALVLKITRPVKKLDLVQNP